jgi:hypothetical protein
MSIEIIVIGYIIMMFFIGMICRHIYIENLNNYNDTEVVVYAIINAFVTIFWPIGIILWILVFIGTNIIHIINKLYYKFKNKLL